MNEALLQALIRFGRTVGGYAVALALESLGSWIGLLELDALTVSILTPLLGGALNALAKLMRGADVPAPAGDVRGATRRARTNAAFWLPF